MSAMTNYLENKLADQIFRGIPYTFPTTLYAALLTASPDDTGVLVEVSGNGYARVAVACNTTNWSGTQGAGSTTTSSGTGGTVSNNVAITFPTPSGSWGDIVGVALMDASTGGNALYQGMLTQSLGVPAGSPAPSFPAGAFSNQVDN